MIALKRLPLALALPFILASAAWSAAGAEDTHTIRPGYWSYTTSTILPGGSQGNQCVRPDQIDDFMSGPHNRHYHCTYPKKSVANGHAFFDGVCVSKHGNNYKLTAQGAYSPTSFNLKGHVSGIMLLGMPITAPISIDAKWLGPECPANAESAAK